MINDLLIYDYSTHFDVKSQTICYLQTIAKLYHQQELAIHGRGVNAILQKNCAKYAKLVLRMG